MCVCELIVNLLQIMPTTFLFVYIDVQRNLFSMKRVNLYKDEKQKQKRVFYNNNVVSPFIADYPPKIET